MLNIDDEYALFTLEQVEIKSIKENCKICLVKDSVDGHLYIKREYFDKVSMSVYKTLAHIKHKHLPKIFHFIEFENGFVVIEEYIHGESLKEKLAKKLLLSESQVLDYSLQLCEILEILHEINQPIIHRDIKPANILCSNDGIIKLIDFDAAKEYKDLSIEDTVTLGTKAYAAPEQFGYSKTDNKTDIYCLGATMFQLLTGVIYVPKENLNLYNGKLKQVIKRCVQIDPGNRYNSMADLKKDLEVCAGIRRRIHVFPDLKTSSPYKKAILGVFYIIATLMVAIITFANLYDITGGIFEIAQTYFAIVLMFIIPYALICNIFGIRDMIPLFHKKTIIHYIIGIAITMLLLFCTFIFTYGILEELKVSFT